jgi:hypothetical protein
VKEKRKGREGR